MAKAIDPVHQSISRIQSDTRLSRGVWAALNTLWCLICDSWLQGFWIKDASCKVYTLCVSNMQVARELVNITTTLHWLFLDKGIALTIHIFWKVGKLYKSIFPLANKYRIHTESLKILSGNMKSWIFSLRARTGDSRNSGDHNSLLSIRLLVDGLLVWIQDEYKYFNMPELSWDSQRSPESRSMELSSRLMYRSLYDIRSLFTCMTKQELWILYLQTLLSMAFRWRKSALKSLQLTSRWLRSANGPLSMFCPQRK